MMSYNTYILDGPRPKDRKPKSTIQKKVLEAGLRQPGKRLRILHDEVDPADVTINRRP